MTAVGGDAPRADVPALRMPPVPSASLATKAGFVPPSAFAAKLPLSALVNEAVPDPGVVKDGSRYIMVGTTNESRDTFYLYQAALRDGPWERVKDTMGKPRSIFPARERPAWISETNPDRWAPELHQIDGRWACVYTARHRDGDLRVAVALADEVTGPYRDLGPVLQAQHGVIDATVVRDRHSGALTMVYKNDDNAAKLPTPILARTFRLDGDALVWTSAPHEIALSGEGHGGLIEGPWLVHENNTTWITLSSDYYGGAAYKTWIGHIDDLSRDRVEGLTHLLTSDSPCLGGAFKGPGHNSLVWEAPGVYSLFFHAWPVGTEETSRWEERFAGGEQRRPLRVTLAFVDERGEPCKPYIVEDTLCSSK